MAGKTAQVRTDLSQASGEADRADAATLEVDYVQIAILELGDAWVPSSMAFPREVAVAFAAGRPTLSWLVRLSDPAISAVREASALILASDQLSSTGFGLPAAVVGQELAAAVAGYRVVSSNPPRVRGWLLGLFGCLEDRLLPFQVYDLYEHVQALRSLPAEQRDASHAASRMVGGGERAAVEAARNAAYTAALSIRVQARRREMAANEKSAPSTAGS